MHRRTVLGGDLRGRCFRGDGRRSFERPELTITYESDKNYESGSQKPPLHQMDVGFKCRDHISTPITQPYQERNTDDSAEHIGQQKTPETAVL